jgi:hypothetical protein
VRCILGYFRYDSPAAREAINDLYGNELRLFQNFFLPSVKLAKRERVGSRLRRRYEAPATPWQQVRPSGQADPQRLAELAQQRGRLDPFQLSRRIQTKLEGVFRLSRETAASAPARPEPAQPQRHSQPLPDERPRREKDRAGDAPKKGGCQVVETPRGGKRGKLKKRVSHSSLRAWKSGKQRQLPTFAQPRRRRISHL